MAIPSSQVVASWVKAEVISVEWISLREVCFTAVKNRWKGQSEDEIWEFVEENLKYVAEHLRDEASEYIIDGSAPRFEIDSEQVPYLRAKGVETSELLKQLRRIDPFKVEELCAKLLQNLGASAFNTQRTSDGGVDF